MSTFTKNYYHPKNDEIFLTLRWEQGYKNVEIFHGDELIRTITSRSELIKGVTWVDDVLGKISVKLSTDRPMKIVLKVKRKKFKTVNLKKYKESYNIGAVRFFFGFMSVVYALSIIPVFSMTFVSIEMMVLILINLIILLSYLTPAIFIRKFPSLFYLGASIYLFTSLVVFLGYFGINTIVYFSNLQFYQAPIIFILAAVFRVCCCLMLIYQFKGVRNEIASKRNKKNISEVLD